jgi:hypothetical protein
MLSTAQIQNANLLRCITAAADAGVAPGTPLTAVDKDGNEVEWSMAGGIQVTFEILDDESGIKLGYGLTPKDTGVCTKFYQYIGIDRAYEEVRYRKQGYKKVVDKWVKPGKPVNDEAIRRGMNKGEWLKQPEFLVDRPARGEYGKIQKDEDGNTITEKVPLKEVGGKYSCNNLKPSTLNTLLAGAVVEPKTKKPASMTKIVYPTGVEEKGDFVDGQLHGTGTRTHPNGSVERGTFVHGRWQAPALPTVDTEALAGTLFLPNGVVITGTFRLMEPAEEPAEVVVVAETEEDEEEAAGPSRRPQRKRKAVDRYQPKGWTAGANNGHTAGRAIDPPDFSFDPTGRGDPVAQPRGVCNLPQIHGQRNGGPPPRCSGYKRDDFVVSDAESSDESSEESSDESSSSEDDSEDDDSEEEAPAKKQRQR